MRWIQNELENYILVVAVSSSMAGWEDKLCSGLCDLFWVQHYLSLFDIYQSLPFQLNYRC